jgi:TolA-binding protein
MPRLLRTLAPALLLAASACWVPLERGQMMEQRIGKLESSSDGHARRLDDLQRRVDEQERVVKDRVAAVDKKIAEAQQKIDELNQAARRSGADLGVQVSRIQDDLNKSKGDLEVEQHKLQQLAQQVAELQQNTDTRFAALRGRGALDEADAKQLIDGLPNKDDKAALLGLAQGQEQKNNLGVARAIYDEYYRRWPSDPAAADAAAHSGALAAQQQRWKESFVSYGWVYKNAPRSDRAPDAMLGMATAMDQLDELKTEAPAMLKELVAKFPKSAAAAKAKTMLADLTPKKGVKKVTVPPKGGKVK